MVIIPRAHCITFFLFFRTRLTQSVKQQTPERIRKFKKIDCSNLFCGFSGYGANGIRGIPFEDFNRCAYGN